MIGLIYISLVTHICVSSLDIFGSSNGYFENKDCLLSIVTLREKIEIKYKKVFQLKAFENVYDISAIFFRCKLEIGTEITPFIVGTKMQL